MKIYTKGGDKGKTSLLGGTRVSKAHLRIDAYGNVDELNSWIGVLRDHQENTSRNLLFIEIQDRLFTLGSNLAKEPGESRIAIPNIAESDVERLEKVIDEMNSSLPPMKNFVLPGGHPLVSFAHVARTVCRRAERGVVALQEHEEVNELIIMYLNRLSDYLFMLSRALTQELKANEVPWIAKK